MDQPKVKHTWQFKGSSVSSMVAYQDQSGLWYAVAHLGHGRYLDRWAIYVFPPHARFNTYQGARNPEQVLPMSLCLWQHEDKGGRDFGKGYMSKGGHRPARDIPYLYQGKEFDGSMLGWGDTFLQHVVGFEPTVEGIKEGIARLEESARQKQIALEEERMQWQREREIAHEAYLVKQAACAQVFAGVVLPSGWHGRITDEGQEVWQFDANMPNQQWSRRIFSTLEQFEEWKKQELADQAALKAAQAAAAEKARQEAAVREAEEVKRTAALDKVMAKLPDIKKKLGGL